MRSKAPGQPRKKPATAPARRAGGRRRREPRPAVAPKRDPLARLEDITEDGQAAAMSAGRALDVVLAVRLGPAPEALFEAALAEAEDLSLGMPADLFEFEP